MLDVSGLIAVKPSEQAHGRFRAIQHRHRHHQTDGHLLGVRIP